MEGTHRPTNSAAAEDAPNNFQSIIEQLPAQFREGNGPSMRRMLAYDNLAEDACAFFERLLRYG